MKTPVAAIRREIEVREAITFARFMELALYDPATGYYETGRDRVGCAGDFITSVSTGEMFGQLLAFQFADWLAGLPRFHGRLCLIEAGAHDGKLALDILRWLQRCRPELFTEIDYWILEPSIFRQSWQKETLKEFIPRVGWFLGFEDLKLKVPESKITGVIFSNELLDAFPVHRYGWSAGERKWFEWGVRWERDRFTWAQLNLLSPILSGLPADLLAVLPDGYSVEISPAAEYWWQQAAGILSDGKLVAIDYGFTSAEQFSPARIRGTLRAYRQHRLSDDLLAHPGDQDLTAHVNFSAIQKAGEDAGLVTEGICTQAQFLTRILAAARKEKSLADLTARQVRQFQTLTHPEHFGRAFQALVQSTPARVS